VSECVSEYLFLLLLETRETTDNIYKSNFERLVWVLMTLYYYVLLLSLRDRD
jgi:hypothetical protein